MIGAGTVISPIVRIVTTVAILAAVYFFIVKPTLDTTKDITDSVTGSVNEATHEALQAVPSNTPNSNKLQRQIQHSIDQAQQSGGSSEAVAQAQKLGECMQQAVGNVDAVQACANKYAP
jgi:F0F1-type ATP synthase membrane subunit b/b'